MSSSRQNILITGAQGQVGSQCVQSMMSSSFDFRPIAYSHDQMNISDPESIQQVLKQDIQAVINCAAYTAVDLAQTESEKAWLVNAKAPKLLAQACAVKQIPLIHFSSDYVYDNGIQYPLKESDPCNPKSIYAISKYVGEQDALYYHDKTLIIRTSWVYARSGQNFVNTMLRLSKEKEELNIVNDQIGSPTYTPDLVKAALHILKDLLSPIPHPRSFGIFNFSNQGNISWYDFAMEIMRLSKSTCKLNPIPTSDLQRPAARPSYSVFNLTKIESTFGIAIKDWRASLAECFNQD